MEMTAELKRFVVDFLKDRGLSADAMTFQFLGGDGSKRMFWRVSIPLPGIDFVIMANPPTDEAAGRENFAYLMIGKHLLKKGVPVPDIYRYELDHGWFIMKDLGAVSLQDAVSSLRDPLSVYETVVKCLFRLQIEGAKDFDPNWCCQTERYDRTVMLRYEADYFKDAFLAGYLGLKKEWPELHQSFHHLAEKASCARHEFFLHRDFQSRNIMVSKGTIGIVDWQGGRLGPLGYDLASLLIDPYSSLSSRQRERIYTYYLSLVRAHDAGLVAPFESYYPYLAIQRNIQILGAFSYLTKVMKKPYFEAYIPRALETLNQMLHLVEDREVLPLKDFVTRLWRDRKQSTGHEIRG
jgi:aminoglycoside/choline kinase family phosphotransferase